MRPPKESDADCSPGHSSPATTGMCASWFTPCNQSIDKLPYSSRSWWDPLIPYRTCSIFCSSVSRSSRSATSTPFSDRIPFSSISCNEKQSINHQRLLYVDLGKKVIHRYSISTVCSTHILYLLVLVLLFLLHLLHLLTLHLVHDLHGKFDNYNLIQAGNSNSNSRLPYLEHVPDGEHRVVGRLRSLDAVELVLA